ncbi:preprotein translocase subunit SecA [Desulfobacter latus]|uniref:Protein translocase subunit SecA n=1 Tax=Desulfobacter latus TaxID=2292 RepID=A0A850SZK4_9BACT|nr:preprotein translocase subunit SecA [Desulfobacter latus]NWH05550.1 preprotein translocase subunit SecA [Desulfobacter latus]
MVLNFMTKLFGSSNDRILKKIQPIIDQINEFEPRIQALSDIQIGEKTTEFKKRLAKGETLDDILPEAFALVREASVRTLGLRHYDVQLIGGIALHRGTIAEMKTGEGKTLMSTLPAYLNALTGKGVHIVTVNDYLARRDAEWMSQVYDFLGLTVGVILHDMDAEERKHAYAADITYGTNNEFGFDYLRDNMKFEPEELAQGDLHFAIVDEVDSILIDEARTPLIISGPAEKSTHLYTQANTIIPAFEKDTDYTLDEESKTVSLTEDGIAKGENLLHVDNLYDPANIELLHHLNQALKAHVIFKRDTDYIVKNDQVVIVDEFTGRLMDGRRYSEGLHQALEAKEGVKIENENQTLASITFQNYFRMYDKLSGMTGTADTEAEEFKKIYNLDVLVIPTHKPMVREDRADLIYKTQKEKYDAAITEIIRLHQKGQPVLVGTISIDVSESLSEKLKKKGIKHNVLNAKHHKEEAEIVANAGQKGAVTISTNMAGRGTDIKLGEGVKALGGLHILGTSRHESRRIDNQLRGRSGRQGDPGSSRFYLSLEDDLLRIFGGDRIHSVMDRLGIEEGEHIEHKLISKAIENAQTKVEGHNFEIRKHLLEYDDVMNQQREIIYRQRREALTAKDLKQVAHDMMEDVAYDLVDGFVSDKTAIKAWDLEALSSAIKGQFNMDLSLDKPVQENFSADQLGQYVFDAAQALYRKKEAMYGPEIIRHVERFIILQTVDTRWKEHLLNMDHLKEGIGLRGYAQQDPLRIYKKEGFDMFQDLMNRIKQEVVDILFKIQIASPTQVEEMKQEEQQDLTFSSHTDEDSAPKQPVRRSSEKISRNAPCPCGSGKKYKKCCGQ